MLYNLVLIQILTFLLCRPCTFNVEVFPGRVDAVEGNKVSMYCKEEKNNLAEDFNWNRCMWTRIRDNATCHYIYHQGGLGVEIHEHCDEKLKGGMFFGSRTLFKKEGINDRFGINIPRVYEEDRGEWMCKLDYYNMKTQPENQCTANSSVVLYVSVVLITKILYYQIYLFF